MTSTTRTSSRIPHLINAPIGAVVMFRVDIDELRPRDLVGVVARQRRADDGAPAGTTVCLLSDGTRYDADGSQVAHITGLDMIAERLTDNVAERSHPERLLDLSTARYIALLNPRARAEYVGEREHRSLLSGALGPFARAMDDMLLDLELAEAGFDEDAPTVEVPAYRGGRE